MWVILAKKGLDKHRDEIIADILGQEKEEEPDLYIKNKVGYGKYSTTGALSMALMYKHEASCKRFVKRFQKSQAENTITRYDKFYWLREFHVSYRKVTSSEWGRMCDDELDILNRNYEWAKSVISKKRDSFK